MSADAEAEVQAMTRFLWRWIQAQKARGAAPPEIAEALLTATAELLFHAGHRDIANMAPELTQTLLVAHKSIVNRAAQRARR